MNRDRIEGNWKQLKGKVIEQWGELTHSDMDVINGRREILSGKMQEHYGVARDEAAKHLSNWHRRINDKWL